MIMDKLRFIKARDKVISKDTIKQGIGTLAEKSLHSVLKYYFEPDTNAHEIRVNGFVADIKNENGIIEIQTGNFNKMRRKLDSFLIDNKVKIVYPIENNKWLIWINDETGEITKKRKSPKKGTPYQAYFELYKIKTVLTNPNLSIDLVFLDIDEYRLLNGWSDDLKKGSSRYERVPVDIIDEIHINVLADYMNLMPCDMPTVFKVKDFKKASGLSLRGCQTAINILKYIGLVEYVGKEGKAFLYKIKAT
jgi:hypothetical protein